MGIYKAVMALPAEQRMGITLHPRGPSQTRLYAHIREKIKAKLGMGTFADRKATKKKRDAAAGGAVKKPAKKKFKGSGE